MPLNDSEIKFLGDTQNFDEKTFKELFNDFQIKSIELSIDSPKALLEMSDEELLDWVHKLDDFVRVVKVAATSSRVKLEDRKLQLSQEQRAALDKLDRAYKPKTVKIVKEKKEAKERAKEYDWATTPELKRVAAVMKLLGLTREDAEAWIKEQKKG